MPNPVFHFEIGCVNTKAQQDFSGKLFDWEVMPTCEEWNYGLVQHSEDGIGGGISDSGENPHRPIITFHVQVNNLQVYLDKAVSLGGAQVLPPMNMEVNDSKFGIAGFIDPKGNYIGLFKPAQ